MYIFNPILGRDRQISEFEVSLVYRVSSRISRATQRNPVSAVVSDFTYPVFLFCFVFPGRFGIFSPGSEQTALKFSRNDNKALHTETTDGHSKNGKPILGMEFGSKEVK